MGRIRHRFARLARRDDGFILPYILLVTILILVGTGTMLTVVMNNAVPASHTQSQATALAAAQSGVQTYVAELNANCAGYSIGECQWPFDATANAPRTLASGTTTGAPSLTQAAYTATATNAQGYLNHSSDDLRVLSTGCVPACGSPGAVTTRLLADISGTPNALRFAYFTNYESIDGGLISSMYPPTGRTIRLNGAFAALAGATNAAVQTAGGTVTWSGAANPLTCNQTWAAGRGGGTADDATETLLSKPAGVSGTYDHYCSVAFTKGMNFVGPVYSADQFLLSSGIPNAVSGPSFSVGTACSVAVTTNCDPYAPASSPAVINGMPKPSRSLEPPLRATASTKNAGIEPVQPATFSVTLPASAADASASCVYSGNTHISFVDPPSGSPANSPSTATVSGGTLTSGKDCSSPITNLSHKTLVVDGTIYVHGDLNASAGQVSVVALPGFGSKGDIVIDGNLTAKGVDDEAPNQFGENGFGKNSKYGAIDLVATNDVVMQHDVTCAADQTVTIADFGFCANDISGLYTTAQSRAVVNDTGTLKNTHPARQYCNATGDRTCGSSTNSSCDTYTDTATVDAAIFALNGSFRTANYNRGCALGTLNVVGGIYQNHRGPLGQEWETTSTSTVRAYSGYKLQLTYESLQSAGLPYVPALQGGSSTHPWIVVAVSSPTNGSGS